MSTTVQITTEAKDNAYIIHMIGEIDVSNLSDLESIIKPIIDNANVKAIILDCKDLLFIDSKVVGYIAYLSTTFGHSERKLLIASANETINDILTLVGLTAIVPQFSTIDEALVNI
jgi:anti-anti-sigma factor